MTRYMLDTNTVSRLLKGLQTVAHRVVAVPITSLCISAITEGELLFGLAKRPDAKVLHFAVGISSSRRRPAMGCQYRQTL